MLPVLWRQVGEGFFLFQHDSAPMHKARPITERLAWRRFKHDAHVAEWERILAAEVQNPADGLSRRAEADIGILRLLV